MCSTPLTGYDGILPALEDDVPADESAYASAIGSLGYAANSTRPDISFATYRLAQFNSSPVIRHWNTACKVFRYLKGSTNFSITYNFGPLSNTLNQDSKPILYSDSDFASDFGKKYQLCYNLGESSRYEILCFSCKIL